MHVVVLGCHPAHSPSMQRYTKMLVAAYEAAGCITTHRHPLDTFSRHIANRSVRKLAIYLEELAIFPLALALRPDKLSVIHIADHSDAPWALIPTVRRQVLITCHDLIAIRSARGETPEHQTRWTGRLYQRLISRGIESASSLIAISNATRQDVSRLFPGSKVTVVYNPISPRFQIAASERLEPMRAEPIPYLLIVSSSGWRKNRGLALRLWVDAQRVEPSLQLYIVGPPLTPEEIDAARVDHSSELLTTHVKVYDKVTDEQLVEYYHGATALLQTSLYEGFCWPVVEANACGTLAICSDIPVLREVGPFNVFVPSSGLKQGAELVAEAENPARKAEAQTDVDSRFGWQPFARGIVAAASAIEQGQKRYE